MIDRRRKVVTNLDNNVVPIEFAAWRIFGHGLQMYTEMLTLRVRGETQTY